MKIEKTIVSDIDKSINIIYDNGMEARFVQRQNDYFIVYLSSHTGCNKACRMCHLTQLNKTNMIDATFEEYFKQAQAVIAHKMMQSPPVYFYLNNFKKIHFNFMAVGEFFSNKNNLTSSEVLFSSLRFINYMFKTNLKMKFNISTIMPKDIEDMEFNEIFHADERDVRIYYSLYSMNEKFRKRWLPKAMAPKLALNKLARFQQWFQSDVKLHWAFIKDENDSIEELKDIFDYCEYVGLKPKFNIVRYNPYSIGQRIETDNLKGIKEYIGTRIGIDNVKIIPRVGEDCYASCGAFSPA
jgi:adenine C2-methylase RlmN of 23S rRNA A2503 and tRNA A37